MDTNRKPETGRGEPNPETPANEELNLTDIEVNAPAKTDLDEIRLADVEVHAPLSSPPLPAEKPLTDVEVHAPAGTEGLAAHSTERPLNSELATQLMELLQPLAGEDKGQSRSLAEPLTPRQLDVLKLLARGQTNPEIAQELILSPGTVRTHVQRILAKLDVPDRTAAVVRAIELGLITPESGV